MQISLIGINARYTHSCLALFYVRNELMKHCEDVKISLEQFTINDPYYELLLRICRNESDYYFFSTAIWNSDLVVKLIDDVLKVFSHAVCVVGGPQAGVVRGKVYDDRCVSVVGEIERVSPDFYRDLENHSLDSGYTCGERKSGFSSPYTASDLKQYLQHRHIYYETSRGCPFSCSYCLSSAKKGVYHKEIDLVREELTLILAENPKEIRFVDRTFNDNMKRCLAIWEFLLEQECDTRFHFEISPDRFTEEMFAFLENLPPDIFEFEIGVQSTSQVTLDAIGRPVDTAIAGGIISRLADLENIHLHVDLILGLPYETEGTFLESFRDVFAMGPHYIQMGLLKILPDTPIFHDSDGFGYVYSDSTPYPVLANMWLDQQKMQHLYWFCECVERFLNNRYFVSLWRYLRRISFDIVSFFLALQKESNKADLFDRAPTQELLTEVLLDVTSGRDDADYVLELLRYDWLRCGHKFLPGRLKVDEEVSSRVLKKELFGQIATSNIGSLTGAERAYCFKKGFFVEFSGDVLDELGYSVGSGRHYLCFLPAREESLYRHCKTVLFTSHDCEDDLI